MASEVLCRSLTGGSSRRLSTRPHRDHIIIKPDNLFADYLGRELGNDQFARSLSVSRTQFGRGCKLHDSPSQRLRILDRHEEAGLVVDDDLAAARRVGCDHRAFTGSRLHQAAGQTLAVRRQNREVTPLPQRRDILDVS